MHKATVERRNSLLTRRNFWQNQTQKEWSSTSTSWSSEDRKEGKTNTITLDQGYLLRKRSWEGIMGGLSVI